MTGHNTPVIGALCEAAGAGDVKRVLALFAESVDADVVLHEAGLSPARVVEGRAQVLAAVGQAAEFVDVTRIEVQCIGPDVDCVVDFLHTRLRPEAFRRRGVQPPPDTPMAQVWRFRHGRIVEIRPFPFDQPTIPLP